MAPIVQTPGLSPLVPVPWAGVRAWLDQAEATQAATGGSTAHVTPSQLLALSQLASFCGSDEPDVSRQDHVSKLMRMSSSRDPESVVANDDAGAGLSQARRLGAAPTFEMSDPIEVPFRGAFQLRWHCACVLPWCARRFPPPSGDAEQGKEPPALFTNKKDAKQYAAMLAVAYLDSVTKDVATSRTAPRETPPLPPPKQEEQQEKQLPPEQQPTQQAEQQQQQQTPLTQPAPTEPVAIMVQPSPAQHAPKQVASHLPPFEPIPVASSPSPLHPQPSPPSTPPTPPPPSTSQGTITTTISTAAPSSPRLKRPLDSPTTPEPTRRSSPLKTDRNQRHRSSSPAAPDAAADTPVPFASPQGRGAEAAAEQSRLFGAIARLCAHLGVSQPQYRLTQDADRPSFFSGHAEFSAGSRVPEGVAVARGVLGKRQARIHIAEQVLAWMEKEKARRQKLVDGMLS
ncbi:hypothetical protein ISF_01064 [Cordyceps fumosorosea ARSEF 2679]|uniref:DRBM domain-containing protein n=1 Tax=Cordyceps fumosorosea (strain ARSEF 2679) TaxID=1081104 RepID=A0A168ESP3_CORFA|nr:hypothetical protein ISF_01064 [Cordyceps fumosorosea ARSEF 2679]OAA74163.1 hypothetical protein ISF_01064 [Cordyceps fumosorosea ARSEF 2679]